MSLPPLLDHLFTEHGRQAFADGLVDAARDCRLAGQGFQASPVAATASRPSCFNDHVANFTCVAGGTRNDLAAADQAAADPGSHEHGDHVAKASTGSEPEFGVPADTNVVSHDHWSIQRPGELWSDREIPDVQIGAEEDDAGVDVERARTTDTRSHDLGTRNVRSRESLVDASDHLGHDRRSPLLGRGGSLGTTHDSMVAADHTRQNLGPTQVDPDHRGPVALPGHSRRLQTLVCSR